MKILLISPTVDTKKRTNKGLMMPQLALYILKGLTPKHHHVEIIEEENTQIDLEADCDIVGISCMTANAPRSYFLCEEFKKRGKIVVIGGVHPSILPDEAAKYANVVVIGEAEGVWEKLLEDYENNNLQKTYFQPSPNLDRYIHKDFSSILKRKLFNVIPIMTTRGCPYNCSFCCVSNLYGKSIRHIPIEHIVREIKESKEKNFMFLDDNIIGHPKYAKELFKAIKPLNINWVGQASVSLLLNDSNLLNLAAESGCKVLFIGIESVSKANVEEMRKSIKDIQELEKALKRIKKLGILIHASMVFGFDNDTTEVFDEAVDFLIKNKVSTVSFNILTPYPGTKVYDDLKAENRLRTNDWTYYDHNTVVFNPKKMTPYELQVGKLNARKNFYSIPSILKRFLNNINHPIIYLAMNYGHIKQTKVEAKRLEHLKNQLQ